MFSGKFDWKCHQRQCATGLLGLTPLLWKTKKYPPSLAKKYEFPPIFWPFLTIFWSMVKCIMMVIVTSLKAGGLMRNFLWTKFQVGGSSLEIFLKFKKNIYKAKLQKNRNSPPKNLEKIYEISRHSCITTLINLKL